MQENAWDDEEETNEHMINKWKQFLQTPYAKANVPNWFNKLQSAIQNVAEPDEQVDSRQSENTREEWMIISDLRVPFSDSPQTDSVSGYD